MATVPNLWGEAAKSLTNALYGDPAKAASDAADMARAGLYNQQALGARMKNESMQGLDAVLGGLGSTPESYSAGLPAALGALVRSEVSNPGNVLTPFLASRAMVAPDAMSDTLGRGALITSGASPSEAFATNTRRADAISARDAAEDMAQATTVQGMRNQGAIDLQRFKFDNDPAAAALGELLNQTAMGPHQPGAPAARNPAIGDMLFEAGMRGGNEGMMRMGLLENQRQTMRDMQTERRLNDQVNKYAKEADEFSGFVRSLTNLDETMDIYGPTGDLPGFGLTGGVPSIMLSDEGKQLRQDYKAVQNGIVYLLSGKQINEAEGRRLAEQLGGTIENGTFKITKQFTDDQLRRGVQNVTAQIADKLHNTGAFLSPEALDLYNERGGSVPPTFLDEMLAGFDDMGTRGIPPEAIDELMLDPSPEARAEFDEAFGAGAADTVLGGQ